MDNSGIQLLAGSFNLLEHLQLLDLSGNNIEEEMAIAIFNGIHAVGNSQSCLRVLDVSGNRLGVGAALALRRCFQFWPNLQTLSVSGTPYFVNVGDSGALVITEHHHFLPHLKSLDLSSNDITTENGLQLITNLSKCNNLDELDLQDNQFNDADCKMLRHAASKWIKQSPLLISGKMMKVPVTKDPATNNFNYLDYN